jgi:hypothetical protein
MSPQDGILHEVERAFTEDYLVRENRPAMPPTD